MTQLISKVQYKRSEKGEFHEVAERNLDDTISLILNYPWGTERSLASIKLSCPSVTIGHPIGTYLKVGPYFSGKFSLYYLDTNNKVYLKIANTLEDACVLVKTYFEQEGQLQGFERYGFTIKPSAHFRTNPFEYTIDAKALISFFMFPLYMAPVISFMIWLKYLEHPESFSSGAAVGMVLFFLILFSPLIYFFFNYLSADKNCYIQISRGHDEFFFGTVDSKKLYSKLNIAEINAYGVRYSRSPWRECEVFNIIFKNGEQIRFTSLLISSNKLLQKFPDHKIIDNKRFFPTVGSV
ncbi:hypothetical protein [Pedobacter nyackensis]|uniref:PH domain-containing protein n=1 Tax=Pedobacter nyackensis TaxID=475255 RepID=A0A1W2AL62_9SPHI|nr:hypothetical protein [Pedobacter nyackensis]SMC61479.1 hypothetical protein SAMN04488101_101728 [Pedobacter nyackensis]